MAFELFRGTATEISDRLNGAVLLGPYSPLGLGLGGLTLNFSSPAVTVTFPGGPGQVLTPAQFMAAIQDEIPDVHFSMRSENANTPAQPLTHRVIRLALWRDAGFSIANTGTANAVLGITTLVAPGVVERSKVVGMSQSPLSDSYILVLSDAATSSGGDGGASAESQSLIIPAGVPLSAAEAGVRSAKFVHRMDAGLPIYANAETYPEALTIGAFDPSSEKLLIYGLAEMQFSNASAVPALGSEVFLARSTDDIGGAALGKATVSPPSRDFVARVGVVTDVPVDFMATRLATIMLGTPTRDILKLAGA